MSKFVRSILAGVCGLGLVACGGDGDSVTLSEPETSSIRLELTTQATSGNIYRLGPATFDITNVAEQTVRSVDAGADEPALHVAVEPGDYEVSLRDGWVLQLLDIDGNPTPITATLTSPSAQFIYVEPFQTTPLTFSFHLGESAIDIGIDVDEGVPPGYDGMISPLGDGRYIITFASGGGACCWDSVAEAQAAYPDFTFFIEEP